MAITLGNTSGSNISGADTINTTTAGPSGGEFVSGSPSQLWKPECYVTIDHNPGSGPVHKYKTVTWTGNVLTIESPGLLDAIDPGSAIYKTYEGYNGDQAEHSRKYVLGII